jgi:hypothetical protein
MDAPIRALAGKLGRFQRGMFSEFVPESFRWTGFMSRPGTKALNFWKHVSLKSAKFSHKRSSIPHSTLRIQSYSWFLIQVQGLGVRVSTSERMYSARADQIERINISVSRFEMFLQATPGHKWGVQNATSRFVVLNGCAFPCETSETQLLGLSTSGFGFGGWS